MISIINHVNDANMYDDYLCVYVHNFLNYKNRCVAEYIKIIFIVM
jgi:hypothetical protein